MRRAGRDSTKGSKSGCPVLTTVVRTVHIEYSVENALRFIDVEDSDFEAGHDELYWNVTGDEWEIPIHAVTARVLVPPRGHWPGGSCLHGLPRFDQL